MDKVVIKSSGLLYAGENNSDYLFAENLNCRDGHTYVMRLKSTCGDVYITNLENGKVNIGYELISRPGRLSAELCEKIDDDYTALSGIFIFPVFESIEASENTPPPYEQAKSLAERAIEAAELAEQHKLDGKDGVIYYPEFEVDENGDLILSAEEINGVDFRLNGNDLEVILNG